MTELDAAAPDETAADAAAPEAAADPEQTDAPDDVPAAIDDAQPKAGTAVEPEAE